jgi:hypothetical protein
MKKKIFQPDTLANHESGLRKLEAESTQREYVSFASLNDAQNDPEGVVILEGDDGGQIYAVCPVSLIRCNEEALRRLLRDIDALIWNDPSSARLCYERLPVGSGVSGGMGGGVVQNSLWLHPHLAGMGLFEGVKAVIEGRRLRLASAQ